MTASVAKLGSAGAAFDYYSARDDYYMSDHTSAEWTGKGAALLGLSGDIDPHDFKQALDGRIGAAQVAKEGHQHTPGWDMTFSAPKSVSIAALVNKDERLTMAHDRAVRVALDHLEKVAAVTRQRDSGGSYKWTDTGSMVIAAVRHSTSRNGDPQLHTHSVIANLTQDPASGKWLSLDSRAGLYAAQREAGNVYMSELARGARAAGYAITWHVDAKGNTSFELDAVADAERREFSSRRQEIEAALQARGIDPATASGQARQAATLDTRSPKQHEPGAVLHARWEAQAQAGGFDVSRRPADARASAPEVRSAAAADAVQQAMESIAERETRFTGRQLLAEATTYAQGRVGQAELASAIAAARECGELLDREVQVRGHGGELESQPGYTTTAGAALETDMLDRAGRLAARPATLTQSPVAIDATIASRETVNGHPFTPEQRDAVNAILSGRDGGLAVVQGYAGTAKTTSVHAAIADAAKAAGIRVRAIAPTHSAAATLAQALGTEYQTVASINARMLDRDGRPELWIVDEAGMVSAKDMRDLLRKADLARAEVVLSGDVKQIGSVGAGAAFQQLRDALPERTHSLTEIKRQTSAELKQAVYDSLSGRFSEALGKVDTREMADHGAAVDAIADRYMQDTHAGKSTLVVTLSNADRRAVNAAIQQRRVAAGEVRDVHDVVTLTPASKTAAESRDAARYQPGEVLESLRDFRHGPQRGELLTVTRTDGKRVTTTRADGSEWTFNPRKVTALQSLEASKEQFGAGDYIVARGNIRAADASDPTRAVALKNGTSLTVDGWDAGGRMRVTDTKGRHLMLDTAGGIKAQLAYAQTANSAQGRTVDSAIAYLRSNQRNLADRQHVYVALSRARSHATVVTDSAAKLAETLVKSAHAKQMALDPHGPNDRAGAAQTAGGNADDHQQQVPRRSLRELAHAAVGDVRERVAQTLADARSRGRERAVRRFADRDRDWLVKGDQLRERIDRNALRREREIIRRTHANPEVGAIGRLLESTRARQGRQAIERLRAGRDQAERNIAASLQRAFDRASEREARGAGIGIDEARERVGQQVLADRMGLPGGRRVERTLDVLGRGADAAARGIDRVRDAIDRLRNAGRPQVQAAEREAGTPALMPAHSDHHSGPELG